MLPQKTGSTSTSGPGSAKGTATAKGAPSLDSILCAADRAQDLRFAPQRKVPSDSMFFMGPKDTSSVEEATDSPAKKRKKEVDPPAKKELNLPTKMQMVKEVTPSPALSEEMKMLIDASQASQSPQSSRRSRISEQIIPTEAKLLRVCPFCDRLMPRRPSIQLQELMQPWLDKLHAGRPWKATDLLTTCTKHQEEVEVIPNGKKAGWPTMLDLDKLLDRVEADELRSELDQLVQEPTESTFAKRTLELRQQQGNKSGMSMIQMTQCQAGYYGEQGLEVIREALSKRFLSSGSSEPSLLDPSVIDKIKPLTAWEFIDLVLVPEVVCRLIIDDFARKRNDKQRDLSLKEAEEIQQASWPYGMAMFPSEVGGTDNGLYAGPSSSANGSGRNGETVSRAARYPSSSFEIVSGPSNTRKGSQSRGKASKNGNRPISPLPSSSRLSSSAVTSSPGRPRPRAAAASSSSGAPAKRSVLDSSDDEELPIVAQKRGNKGEPIDLRFDSPTSSPVESMIDMSLASAPSPLSGTMVPSQVQATPMSSPYDCTLVPTPLKQKRGRPSIVEVGSSPETPASSPSTAVVRPKASARSRNNESGSKKLQTARLSLYDDSDQEADESKDTTTVLKQCGADEEDLEADCFDENEGSDDDLTWKGRRKALLRTILTEDE